ncbi:GlxA family transcriptional regulator [Actibacterium ureilyticum]|uniref:GlxA family transcriptional regulator n=1 Tax=Actibacterium ureilyticum TaxID=1590614 RepID=UPI000BAAA1B1|nr:helix-turn-helix domain-containing protein [Actibacterium ureilyticum]
MAQFPFLPSAEPLDIDILVLPQAALLTVGSTIDPLRAANRHLGARAFRWRILSMDGGAVPLTAGVSLPADAALGGGPPASGPARALFVIAGYGARGLSQGPLLRDLRRHARGCPVLAGIDSGCWPLAAAGLLAGRRVTTHWEDLEDFAAAHPELEVVPDRYVISGPVLSAGGTGPVQDLMLDLIAARHGAHVAMQVAGTFIIAQRSGAESQVTAIATGLRDGGDPRVSAAVARLSECIDAPEPVARTAAAVGLSARRLQTLFRAQIGIGPGEYALEMRLQAARRLVVDTRHPMAEVALRSGFNSLPAFSRAFRRRFGQPAATVRRSHRS